VIAPGITLRGGTPVNATSARPTDVHIAGDRFATSAAPGALTIDVEGSWIYPGLINAHDHLHLNSLPPLTGLGVFPNAYRWIDAAQARRAEPVMLAAEDVPSDVRLWHGGLKNLLSGVTTVVHHDPWSRLFERESFPVRVPAGYGWCHSLGLSGATGTSPLRYGPALDETIEAAAPRWYIHLAEGTDAVAARELSELDRLGALSGRTVLVHATGLGPSDISRVRESGAWVVWCPASNDALLGRTLDPAPFAGVRRLALGTDSRLSGSADLLSELRHARRRAATLDTSALLRLVTEDAARLVGLSDLGVIASGCLADAVVIDANGRDPYETLLTSTRADIGLIVKNGQPVLASDRFRSTVAAAADDIALLSVDGRAKYVPRAVLGPERAIALEPGVEVLS
jgi:cytosine/adenosine deaminase-related metal-dependent hydrolase